jgi:excisionase family DNA binding protein
MSRLLTPADVAEQLQVEVSTVQGWLRTGRLKGIKLGRYWRIRPEAVEELLAEAEQAKAANHEGGRQ